MYLSQRPSHSLNMHVQLSSGLEALILAFIYVPRFCMSQCVNGEGSGETV